LAATSGIIGSVVSAGKRRVKHYTDMDFFTHDKIKPANLNAKEFAESILELIRCENCLQTAKSNVPDYTAQWDVKDFYAEEQEQWNRAADKLYSLIK
jgi:hypothetical protein